MSVELQDNINSFGGGNGGGATVGANLYDIKTMANAIADKGWAFTCKDTRQDLAKADVPTVYEDILNKYNSADSSYASSYTQLTNYTSGCSDCIASDGTYFYSGASENSKKLKRTLISNLPSMSWEDTGIVVNSAEQSGAVLLQFKLEVGDNLIVTLTSTSKVGIYKKSDFTEYKSITYTDFAYVHLLTVNGKKTFFISYKVTNDGTTTYHLAKIEDSVTADIVELRADLTQVIARPCYDNENATFWFHYGNYICKSTDNFATFTQVQSLSGTDISIYRIGNNMITGTPMYNGTSYITKDNGATWSTFKINNNNKGINNEAYCDGNVLYCLIYETNFYMYKSTDLETFTKINIVATGIDNMRTDVLHLPTTNAILYQKGTPVYYLGTTKTEYTDTINGTSVTYYKSGDYKICIADGGTNDTALATVYSYMGYYNYFVLDTTNETISLPRNSNLYSMMYVGDNYQDTTTGITGNATRLLPQSEVISDSSATVSLDIKGNKDYQLTASALTSLTISSCEDSELGTTIKFNSGTTATTINDTSGIEWSDGATPTPSASKTCLIFIWNNIGFYKEW